MVVQPVVVVVPHGELRHGGHEWAVKWDVPLAAVLLGEDVRIERVAVDVVAEPEEQVRLEILDHAPNGLHRVLDDPGARAECEPEARGLRRRGLDGEGRPAAMGHGDAFVNVDAVVIGCVRLQPGHAQADGVIVGFLRGDPGAGLGVAQAGIGAVFDPAVVGSARASPHDDLFRRDGAGHRPLHEARIALLALGVRGKCEEGRGGGNRSNMHRDVLFARWSAGHYAQGARALSKIDCLLGRQ